MRLLFLLLQLVSVSSIDYHATDSVLKTMVSYCSDSHLSCSWHDDILVLDWNPHRDPDQLWVFNEHARERITAEIALGAVKDLLITRPNKRITIIPVLNVWGRKQVDSGRKCLRKNRNGVDTNRNYQLYDKHPYPRWSEEYEGPSALSEKESQLVARFLNNGIQRYINVHSGEFSMYMPYDHSDNTPPHAEQMKTFLDALHSLCPECARGSAATTSSYKAYGTSVDYAIQVAGVPEAYTFEVYGEFTADCEAMFNPMTTLEYKRVIKMWKQILLRSLNL